ncbi:NADH-quinone oxidoreductase subunit J, partial [Candidatus Bathyarchaeota archaeon]|nr:NADH-quinone oxidoreductase subunit J [Candidatus Bathyarchaeota archaeon]
HIAMIILTLVFTILAAELKDVMKAILALMCANIAVAAIFYLLGAPYLSAFQLLIYAGAVTILLLATIHAGEERGD